MVRGRIPVNGMMGNQRCSRSGFGFLGRIHSPFASSLFGVRQTSGDDRIRFRQAEVNAQELLAISAAQMVIAIAEFPVDKAAEGAQCATQQRRLLPGARSSLGAIAKRLRTLGSPVSSRFSPWNLDWLTSVGQQRLQYVDQ